MSRPTPRRAIFPGTFDPITNGHLDVIRRGAALFDELVVAVGNNPEKQCLLDQDARTEILARILADLPHVRVERFSGLTVDAARTFDASVILRGLRNSSDLEHESRMALTNRSVSGIETVFILTSPQCAFMSSSLIKQIARMGGDISALVPPEVIAYLSKKGRRAGPA
jgi:pantetheine-phosphate adenylyltransferase